MDGGPDCRQSSGSANPPEPETLSRGEVGESDLGLQFLSTLTHGLKDFYFGLSSNVFKLQLAWRILNVIVSPESS